MIERIENFGFEPGENAPKHTQRGQVETGRGTREVEKAEQESGRLKENAAERNSRARKIIFRLRSAFPNAAVSLRHSNPLELLVATILSAQCTDERVNKVTPGLFRSYPKACDFADARLKDLEDRIRTTGFFRNKARAIKACCRVLVEEHDGKVPKSMKALTGLAGVGRKTANVVLGNAFGLQEGIVVDTHVGRISRRLGLTEYTDPVKVEQDLMRIIPRKSWTVFSHLLILHGRATCKARSPDCEACRVGLHCPSRGKV